jgi:hypothetical protein
MVLVLCFFRAMQKCVKNAAQVLDRQIKKMKMTLIGYRTLPTKTKTWAKLLESRAGDGTGVY